MYTWEIEELLKLKKYVIYYDEFSKIINSSPQIKRIKYTPYDDTIETWIEEKNDYPKYFKYKVKKREINEKEGT